MRASKCSQVARISRCNAVNWACRCLTPSMSSTVPAGKSWTPLFSSSWYSSCGPGRSPGFGLPRLVGLTVWFRMVGWVVLFGRLPFPKVFLQSTRKQLWEIFCGTQPWFIRFVYGVGIFCGGRASLDSLLLEMCSYGNFAEQAGVNRPRLVPRADSTTAILCGAEGRAQWCQYYGENSLGSDVAQYLIHCLRPRDVIVLSEFPFTRVVTERSRLRSHSAFYAKNICEILPYLVEGSPPRPPGLCTSVAVWQPALQTYYSHGQVPGKDVDPCCRCPQVHFVCS